MLFSVTFEIVTPESVENGEAESLGFIGEDMPLREAIRYLFETRTSACDGIVDRGADCSDAQQARWFTVYNGMEFRTGAHENRSIHFPESMSSASRARLVNFLDRI